MKYEIIDILSETGIVFRTKELNAQGISNYVISKMIDDGILEKVYQGVYSIGDVERLQMTDINVIVEHGIISLTSAAFYYKLLDGEEGRITLTLNRDQKPPKLPFEIFSYYYTTSKFFEIGLKIIDQNGRQIKIYDRERTICDIIRHRTKYESSMIKQILENYLAQPEKDVDKLFEYAKELRIYSVVYQYIEVLGGI
ncbi:MAG: type IV toxin-antitoxin system AbiEi family antitoxin domain-containing protein [Mycoplasmatales bacterium]